MKAMVLHRQQTPLTLTDIPIPSLGANQLLLKVRACGVCRTDLHIVDGDLSDPMLPLVPGHEIVGEVAQVGRDVEGVELGSRVGVPWLGYTCGVCPYCQRDHENLCDNSRFTGYQLDGGYAEYAVADSRFCFPIPDGFSDAEAAPLLCAGLIGFRSYRLAGPAEALGIYGFGAAAHIIAQVAVAEGSRVYAFTKPGDRPGQEFARRMGAEWAGGSDESPPEELDAAILFAPVGSLVPAALAAVRKGGIVVCAGIHMTDIPSFAYHLLWGERSVRSVANLTRQDGVDFFTRLATVKVETEVTSYSLAQANEALDDLRRGRLTGAAVLIP